MILNMDYKSVDCGSQWNCAAEVAT